MPAPKRLTVSLDGEHAARLTRLAEQSGVREATLARSLLSRAIDEAHPEAGTMAELLNGIPGARERAFRGRNQGSRGETVPLDDL
jgi:hypothetical protein